ncbi:MAG: AI-2E family transporter [FCB group bacterium]|jgi:predicted PurR-regulated permease PerM|nr:AI-2E family transporter [FCB group bacterium]
MPDKPDASTVSEERIPASGSETMSLADASGEQVDVRSLAMRGLMVLAVLYTVYFAKPFLLPIVLATLFTLLLRPFVRALARVHSPEPVGAALVILALLGALGGTVYGLVGPAAAWIEDAPEMATRIESKVRPLLRPMAQMSQATEEVGQKIAAEDGTMTVQLKQPGFGSTILTQVESFLAIAVVVIILMYFLLASGDMFLRKLVKILPNFEEKRRAIEIANEIQHGVSRYLVTVSLIYTGLGVAVGVSMYLLGMPNPVLWGVVAGALNFIPYLGAMVTMVILTAVAILTFDSLLHAMLVPLVFSVITTIEGYVITPTVLGRRLTLNPVVIFVAMTFWWWLWGIVGALLAVPLLAVLKIVCQRVEPLNFIAEFLDE